MNQGVFCAMARNNTRTRRIGGRRSFGTTTFFTKSVRLRRVGPSP
jgi:hypothetical protein